MSTRSSLGFGVGFGTRITVELSMLNLLEGLATGRGWYKHPPAHFVKWALSTRKGSISSIASLVNPQGGGFWDFFLPAWVGIMLTDKRPQGRVFNQVEEQPKM